MASSDTLARVSQGDAEQLEQMDADELVALIRALGTLTDVGTALLNAPAMARSCSPRTVDLLNRAGDLLDEHVEALLTLREGALSALKGKGVVFRANECGVYIAME